jgi:hypothetical protein
MNFAKKGVDIVFKNISTDRILFWGYIINLVLLLFVTFDFFANRWFQIILSTLLVLNGILLVILSYMNYKTNKRHSR